MPSDYLPGPTDLRVDPMNCSLASSRARTSQRVHCKMIMISEAAARPQKLQKRLQMVHRFTSLAGSGKYLRLR